jgi:hypothetical protein
MAQAPKPISEVVKRVLAEGAELHAEVCSSERRKRHEIYAGAFRVRVCW